MSKFSNVGSRLVDGDLVFYSKTTGNDIATFSAAGDSLTVGSGGMVISDLSFGAPEAVTVTAGGAITVTGSYAIITGAGGNADTMDTITKADAAPGDLLLLINTPGDDITVEDTNIDLGDTSRVISDGGSLLLIYVGTSWQELTFITAANNA